MKKVRYEIDPHNRLIIRCSDKKTSLPLFRKVLDGYYKIDKNNKLIYHVKEPLTRDKDTPRQIKLKGKWSLTKNHDLKLTLDNWKRQTYGDQVILKGDIIDVDKNSFSFAVTTRTKENVMSTHMLKLQGSWQADSNNRLTFRAKKQKSHPDTLVLDGVWELSKNHQIIYTYEKKHLLRTKKKLHTLTFKGSWDILDKTRISYVIDRNTNSTFNFRTSLGIFKGNYIKYELGIGLSYRAKPIKRKVALFGKWKIKKNIGLVFEVEYEKGEVYAVVFAVNAKLTDKDTLLVRLKNMIGKDVGVELKLSHKILNGNGTMFFRALKSKRESAIFAGAAKGW